MKSRQAYVVPLSRQLLGLFAEAREPTDDRNYVFHQSEPTHDRCRRSAWGIPLPATLTTPRPTLNRLIRALLKAELVEEVEVIGAADVWRQDNAAHYGLRITNAGREIIALAPCPDTDLPNPPRANSSKVSCVVALLQRDHGATLAELVAATGWLPHTTRAVLTGLRKKGHVLDKTKREGMTCYAIAAA